MPFKSGSFVTSRHGVTLVFGFNETLEGAGMECERDEPIIDVFELARD